MHVHIVNKVCLADALAKATYKRRTKAEEFATFFITSVRSYIAIASYTLFFTQKSKFTSCNSDFFSCKSDFSS